LSLLIQEYKRIKHCRPTHKSLMFRIPP